MPYFKIPYSGYAIVEADSPEEAIEAYEDDDTLLEDKTRYNPEQLAADEYHELLFDL